MHEHEIFFFSMRGVVAVIAVASRFFLHALRQTIGCNY